MNSFRTKHTLGAISAAIAAAFVLISGCANHPSPSNPFTNSAPANSLSDAQTAALQAGASCYNTSTCPPSVGMYVAADTDSVTACTSFLIAQDIAVTNSHCIPSDLKTPGANCDGRIWINFPETQGYAPSRIGCSQIISATDLSQGNAQPDYAFYRLQVESDRPALVVSHEGFADQASYSLVKIDPTFVGSVPSGTLEQTNCMAVYGNSLLPGSDHPGAPLMTLADCQVIHGNSGSPLLDAANQVRGVIQAFIDLSGAVPFDRQMLTETPAMINIGSSFACIQTPANADDSALSTDCTAESGTVDPQQQRLAKSLNDQLTAQITDSGVDASIAQWQPLQIPKDRYYSDLGTKNSLNELWALVPRCYTLLEPWTDPYRGRRGRIASDESETELIPVFKTVYGLDRYLRNQVHVERETAAIDASFEFSPSDLLQSGHSDFKVTTTGVFLPSSLFDYDFDACAAAPSGVAPSSDAHI